MSIRAAFLAAGVPARIARAEAPLAADAMVQHKITTQAAARAFLAQVLHESVRLRYFEEIASGAAYEGRLDLGNTRPGDGRRYKGRGPIQLTGRANYRWAGGRLTLPLESQPHMVSLHAIGWRVAGLYWESHGLSELAAAGQFDAITRRINGGMNGAESRRALHRIVSRFDCRPVRPVKFTPTERALIHEYDQLLAAGLRKDRRRVLRAEMTAARKRIWRAAQSRAKGGDGRGWAYGDREARYRALRARTS